MCLHLRRNHTGGSVLLHGLCRYQPIVDLLHAHHVPHAIILGNHDDEGMLSREDIIRLDMKQPGSATNMTHGVEAGNYWLDIAPSAQSNTVALRLWFLDSHNRGCGGVPGWYALCAVVFMLTFAACVAFLCQ